MCSIMFVNIALLAIFPLFLGDKLLGAKRPSYVLLLPPVLQLFFGSSELLLPLLKQVQGSRSTCSTRCLLLIMYILLDSA